MLYSVLNGLKKLLLHTYKVMEFLNIELNALENTTSFNLRMRREFIQIAKLNFTQISFFLSIYDNGYMKPMTWVHSFVMMAVW